MRIGLICDSHMPAGDKSAQKHFVLRAAEQMKKDGIKTVITIGDITSYGEMDAIDEYLAIMSDFEHFPVLGNSDVRDEKTAAALAEKCPGFELCDGKKKILGINTAYAKIEENDRKKLLALSDGDIVVMHHPSERLYDAEDREFMKKLAEEKALTVLCAHLHRRLYSECGKSRAFGIRAVDPDKSFGDFPCVTYFDTESGETSERLIEVPREAIMSARSVFGISCVDNHRDVDYAAENALYGIELRCNGKGWEPDLSLIPKIRRWRERGGKYLSVHMPNLRWADGELIGADTWRRATEFANAVGANGLTMHPPRVKLRELEDGRRKLLELYVYTVKSVEKSVNIGVENLHMSPGEDVSDRCFGYVPEEVRHWICEINAAVGDEKRVGRVLDVGHARNNGHLASKYPISRWYEEEGLHTVAYHIHQVMQKEEGLKNHNAIEDWFGPQISYASFFHHWGRKTIDNSPIFLEVKGSENFEKSIKAFEKAFK